MISSVELEGFLFSPMLLTNLVTGEEHLCCTQTNWAMQFRCGLGAPLTHLNAYIPSRARFLFIIKSHWHTHAELSSRRTFILKLIFWLCLGKLDPEDFKTQGFSSHSARQSHCWSQFQAQTVARSGMYFVGTNMHKINTNTSSRTAWCRQETTAFGSIYKYT